MPFKTPEINVTAWLLAAGYVVLSACSDSQFSSGGIGEALSKNGRKDSNEGENLGKSSEEEDEQADEPVQISGAYLTCEMMSANEEKESMAVGCTVFAKDGKRADISAFTVHYAVVDATGKDIGCVFSGGDDKYHTMTNVPKAGSEDLIVTAKLESGSQNTVLSTKILSPDENDPAVVPEDPEIPGQKTFGKTTDFHLGDGEWNSNNNKDCSQPLQPQDASGKKLFIEFEVTSEQAKVSVEMTEICGLDDDDSYAVITGDDFSTKKKDLSEKVNYTTLPEVGLKKGKYRFEVHAESILGNIDDFLIGKITFKTDGEIVYGNPVGSN